MLGAQILWKKGPLRHHDAVVKSKKDTYNNIILTIKKTKAEILPEHVQQVYDQVIAAADGHPELLYIFGPKLWLHQHYLDHVLNIYYLLKIQFADDFCYTFKGGRCFAFVTLNGVITNGMLVNRSESYPEIQEHVMIHHNVTEKMHNGIYIPNGSLLLHSYASSLFSGVKFISVFPLAIMYSILTNFKDAGGVDFITRDTPLFPTIPDRYFYQPLVIISIDERFQQHARPVEVVPA